MTGLRGPCSGVEQPASRCDLAAPFLEPQTALFSQNAPCGELILGEKGNLADRGGRSAMAAPFRRGGPGAARATRLL